MRAINTSWKLGAEIAPAEEAHLDAVALTWRGGQP
jgi:hypothetical protein